MEQNERKILIGELRSKKIEGKLLDLYPLGASNSEDIIRLRNKPRNMYFFSQKKELTAKEQILWFENYEKRKDDIYWGIYKKGSDILIGTIRLYDIDWAGRFCEEGSYLIDEEYADEAPYAVESKMLALDIAFDALHVDIIINKNRADNKVMNNMDNQLGFDKGTKIEVNGAEYLHRKLRWETYHNNRFKFENLITYWSKR